MFEPATVGVFWSAWSEVSDSPQTSIYSKQLLELWGSCSDLEETCWRPVQPISSTLTGFLSEHALIWSQWKSLVSFLPKPSEFQNKSPQQEAVVQELHVALLKIKVPWCWKHVCAVFYLSGVSGFVFLYTSLSYLSFIPTSCFPSSFFPLSPLCYVLVPVCLEPSVSFHLCSFFASFMSEHLGLSPSPFTSPLAQTSSSSCFSSSSIILLFIHGAYDGA